MAANENTKFQVNYKLSDGTLINLYAADVKELETGLTDLAMVAALIKSTSVELSGGATATAVQNIQAQFTATPVAASSDPSVKMCRHGQMNFRSGVGEKGPWQGFMCAGPKELPKSEKCDTIWIR
jgi:hypothetical protein|tara:strand:+ start:799 stop:1173 length:375 start_codon:yes stop_codon:yes gene_type:complete